MDVMVALRLPKDDTRMFLTAWISPETSLSASRAAFWPAAMMPVTLLALPVAALSAWLNLQFAPQAAQRRVALTAEAVREADATSGR